MRVLHAVKTVDGARWAIDQVRELVALGLEVHVLLPAFSGRFMSSWRETGAVLHALPVDLPVKSPWRLPEMRHQVRGLVDRVKPDIIHSHFFGTTVLMRMALGPNHPVPRIFQVPGPLHLEHALFRRWELQTAGPADRWIASSRYIQSLYLAHGVSEDRVFLSYYGNHQALPKVLGAQPRAGQWRQRLGIAPHQKVVGNINYIYPPKWYLGQTRGLKRHEDVIDALALVCQSRDDVTGVLVGSQWGAGDRYQKSLARRAANVGAGRILMPGHLVSEEVASAWHDFDLAVHVPSSENCGGVVEPLQAGVPVIASRVGGLPEVVFEGVTGQLVSPGNVQELATAISNALNQLEVMRQGADRGAALVTTMFDATRTAKEVANIYGHIARAEPRPEFFDSSAFVAKF
jgi:glycosyltransferase involved in cell wall biosynthesis